MSKDIISPLLLIFKVIRNNVHLNILILTTLLDPCETGRTDIHSIFKSEERGTKGNLLTCHIVTTV